MRRSVLLSVAVAVLLCALACVQLAAADATTASSAGTGAAATAPSSTGAAAAKVPTYYELLGVTQAEANDAAVLKRAYRKQALLFHPDRASSASDSTPETRERMHATFVRLANAFEVLSSRRMRVRYDHLVSQGQTEYDGTRNWAEFDVRNGFKAKQSKAEREAEFKFKQAAEIFRKAAEDAEEFALWSALSIAFGVALLPAAWMAYSRYSARADAVAQRKGRSSELKASQVALNELRAEQEREVKEAKEADRIYQRELREAREAAAAAAKDEAAAEASMAGAGADSSPDSDSWEVVDGVSQRKAGSGSSDPAAAHGAEEASSESDDDAGSSGVVLRCIPCKKSFKSQAQLDNHENSNQHKKNVNKGGAKKSRRDE